VAPFTGLRPTPFEQDLIAAFRKAARQSQRALEILIMAAAGDPVSPRGHGPLVPTMPLPVDGDGQHDGHLKGR
jgi:hypothetical protein